MNGRRGLRPVDGPRSPTRTRSSSRRTSSSAARARPACSWRAASCSEPGARGARRRHGRVRQPRRARLPRRPRASRGGRHAGDPRVDPRGARLPAEGGGRRRGDPRARGAFIRPRHRALAAAPEHRDPRQPRRRAALDRVVRDPRTSGRYLHHNFVVALLNDLFGIQSRGGCSCAGPYGHRLLGIDLERSHEFEREIARGCEGIKPGWVRVNFNYFISEAVFDYLLEAVEMVAPTAGGCCREYRFEPARGLGGPTATGPIERRCDLRQVAFAEGNMTWPAHRRSEPKSRLADSSSRRADFSLIRRSGRRHPSRRSMTTSRRSARSAPLGDRRALTVPGWRPR